MDSLKDQLLKTKLVNKKQLRRLEHEKRVKQKELGRDGVQAEKDLRRQELKKKEELKQAEQKKQNQLRLKAEEEIKAQQRIDELVAGANVLESAFGPRRFYFVDSIGKIPFLEVSEAIAARLEKGDLAIVEIREGRHPGFFLVSAGVAARLKQLDSETVRFWNQEGRQ